MNLKSATLPSKLITRTKNMSFSPWSLIYSWILEGKYYNVNLRSSVSGSSEAHDPLPA